MTRPTFIGTGSASDDRFSAAGLRVPAAQPDHRGANEHCGTKYWSKKLAQQIRAHDAVNYAESNIPADLSDGRYHAWPDGAPDDAGSDPAVWRNQSASQQLQLSKAHELSEGDGTLVAVLDTGVERSHSALAGLLQPGWDYVDDDPDPSDSQNGRDDDGDLAVDESFGHGTFVSGTVALTAPKARIMPMRVLNSDGRGNLFVVAEAITDAVKAGADVILLAFGWLVFFAAWRSTVLLIISGSMWVCRWGLVAGMGRDVGVGAEAA